MEKLNRSERGEYLVSYEHSLAPIADLFFDMIAS